MRLVLTFMLTLLAAASLSAGATVNVVTTTPDLADFVRIAGGDLVKVDNIVRGDQNPHYIEVKPSYMMKLRSAQLFFMVGMDLEKWAQQIIDGSRNSSLVVVDLSRKIAKLEVPTRLDGSEGDVHPFGNPHYWLNPRNVPVIMEEIVAALSQASPADAATFKANADAYVKTLDAKTREWESLMKPFQGRQIITFHRSWTYFAAWLNLTVAEQVEPKPGVPPSPSHTAAVIDLVRKGGIKAILVEPFYDMSAPEQIAGAAGANVLRVSTSVGGVEQAKDYISMMDYNVRTVAAALK
jgi:zinc/manganese transport system substrate-binding protein